MQVAVIGAGNIGGTLGRKWAEAGHAVVFGVRDPAAEKVTQLLATTSGRARAATVGEAIREGETVLLAIPAGAVEATVLANKEGLDGKIVIDAVNFVNRPVMNSLALLQEHAPEAKLFRAFHNLGWENYAEPVFDGVAADLFYCGEAGSARPLVEGLIADVGLRPVYVGGLEQAPLVDTLTRLWFALALQQGHGRHMAFKMLTPAGR